MLDLTYHNSNTIAFGGITITNKRIQYGNLYVGW